ncbi:MAG TPA: hypothetical protein VJ691_19780 [Vicinamibacterales bacterium]|nr:hypothetical protein [Vicinamibacterales bacterium]
MRQIVKVFVISCVVVLGTASTALAQKDTLPQGRPFQMLHEAIEAAEANAAAAIATLQSQLAALAGRVDAVEQQNAVQDQLIGALQAATNMLQQRMTNAEFNINNLTQWNQFQDQLLLQLSQRVSQLESIASSHGNALSQLFSLHNAQQNHLNAIQNNLNFLNAQSVSLQNQINSLNNANASQQNQLNQLFSLNNQQQNQISSLQNQFNSLNQAYSNTRNQLAAGCPPGQSIRQLIPNGPVVCEVDSGLQTTSQGIGNSSSVGPLQFGSVSVSCPPVPAGQPAFLATGGGHQMSSGLSLVSSFPTAPGSWQITVFNPTVNPNPLGFTAIAHCIRQIAQ